jgi:hypothetical protein
LPGVRERESKEGKNTNSSIAQAKKRERGVGENASDKPDPAQVAAMPNETARKESEEERIRRLIFA